MDVQFEHATNEVLDPRIMGGWGYKFSFSVNGMILTITRTDKDAGWNEIKLRVYVPTDDIPAFTSTVYTYYGLEHEEVPEDTTVVNFHPSVTATIHSCAFIHCESLVRVTIPHHVMRIEEHAFYGCISLKYIRLPPNLEYIGNGAFYNCFSLEALFLPPTVTHVDDEAFMWCKSLRFFHVPETIGHLGSNVFHGCDRLSMPSTRFDRLSAARRNKLTMHKVCYNTSVNRQTIQECVATHGINCAMKVDDQLMTALHILCANPNVTGDCIHAYLQLAPKAAEQEDSEGMTPFEYLCRNDITFIDDRSFSSLMALWYGCMPPQAEPTAKKRKRGTESVDYLSWSKDRLKELCQEKGLFVSGSKAVLTTRIQEADNA